jgi:hypothetical protein
MRNRLNSGQSKISGQQSGYEKLETDESKPVDHLKGSFWLSRELYVRYVAFIYVVAFTVAGRLRNDIHPPAIFHLIAFPANEYEPLLGSNGLTPAILHMERLRQRFPNPWDGLQQVRCLYHSTKK